MDTIDWPDKIWMLLSDHFHFFDIFVERWFFMKLFKCRPLSPDHLLPDPEQSFRSSVRISQYRISSDAVFLPGFPSWNYLPFSAITDWEIQNKTIPTHGCCGLTLQAPALLLRYDGGQTYLTLDKLEQAEQAAEFLKDIPGKGMCITA